MDNPPRIDSPDRVLSGIARLGTHLRKLLRRLRPQRNDELAREQGQTIVRVVVGACVLAYLLASRGTGDFDAAVPVWFIYFLAFLVLSLVAMLWALRDTSSSILRRTTMNAADAAAISYLMIATGETGIPLFVLYLWITLGNGFRYGLRALGMSAVFSLAGFATVVALTPVWQIHTTFTASVFLALLLLPLYAAHLINMLHKALASVAKHRFLARVSRELQTPLKNIIGTTELLENNQRLTPNERSLLGVIRDSVHASLKQIDNVLDFSRLEAGKLDVESTPCDLHEIINLAVEMVRPSAARKNLRFLVRIAPQAPYRLIGDARHLRDILLHSLSEAVKATESGFVCLDVTGRHDSDRHATLRFEVRDTGTRFAHAFDTFRTQEFDAVPHEDGRGFGLTIAQQLVELMGGRLSVDSGKGRDNLLWFEIRLARQPAPDAVDLHLPGIRALLLSQDAVAIEHYRDALTQAQGQLLPTGSGSEALDLLTRAIRLGNPVHALLIDAGLALADDGGHHLTELCGKALSANISTVLISDITPPADRLREYGYSAVLPRRASEQHIFAALHAIPLWRFNANQGVVHVAPWLWSRRDARRRRILVADDNRTNLMIVRRMLERAGYDVDDVPTGTEALERLCAGSYRLAILDMHMPDLSGTSVLRQFRLRRPRSRMATVILTANATFDAQQQSADAGADAYLAKPVTTAELLNEVERLVRETEVEVLSPEAAIERDDDTDDEVILQTEVLAELDRLYQSPLGLTEVLQGYSREGADLLEKIRAACSARDHAAFGEWIRALKSNAANMGAAKLMRVCREMETVGTIDFKRDHGHLLARLEETFAESLDALRSLIQDAQPPSVHNSE